MNLDFLFCCYSAVRGQVHGSEELYTYQRSCPNQSHKAVCRMLSFHFKTNPTFITDNNNIKLPLPPLPPQ